MYEKRVCFNSTMVRLKAFVGHKFTSPKYVSIPQWFDLRVTGTLSHKKRPGFNSTMVRLKEDITILKPINIMFQFHNGSIKGYVVS